MKAYKKSKLSAAIIGTIAAMSLSANAFASDAETAEMEFSLDTMVITASRIPTKITDARADISVITRKEIEDMHMTNVEEALRTVPGVQFLSYGGNGGMNANLSGIRINGSKEVVVLVDGVRVSEFQGDSAGYTYAALTNNMDNIERVEVLRGSAGTLYGSGAKGGVINIITRKINDTKTTIDISAGDFSTRQYKVNTMGRKDNLAYHVYYDNKKSGDFEDGNGKNWQSDIDSKSYGIKLSYDFTPDHTLTLNYDKTKSDFHGYDYIYHNHYDGEYSSDSLTLKDDIKLSERWSNTFTYRRSNTDGRYAQNWHYLESADNDYTYNFISEQATFNSSRHNIVLGIDYAEGKDNNIKYLSSDRSKLGHFKMKNTSYYIQDDWEIIPDVTLSGGLRHDRPTNSSGNGVKLANHTSKSYKLSWDITSKDKVYAGRSDFYILPSMYQLTDRNYGNSELQPAYGRTTTIGYNRNFDDYNILTLNWFETKTERAIVQAVNGGAYQNADNGIARGWNLQYMTQIGENWNANIGWAHLFQHMDEDTYDWGYQPKDLATFGISYNYAKVKATLDGYYFIRRTNAEHQEDGMQGWPSDKYAVINMSASYAPTKNISFYAKVNNLFDKAYAERTNVIYGSGKPGDWYMMPGRSFVVGMQYNF